MKIKLLIDFLWFFIKNLGIHGFHFFLPFYLYFWIFSWIFYFNGISLRLQSQIIKLLSHINHCKLKLLGCFIFNLSIYNKYSILDSTNYFLNPLNNQINWMMVAPGGFKVSNNCNFFIKFRMIYRSFFCNIHIVKSTIGKCLR